MLSGKHKIFKKQRKLGILAILAIGTMLATFFVQAASATIIDTGWATGSKMTTWIQLHKDTDEADDQSDYYSIEVTLEDTYYHNDIYINPMNAHIRIAYRAQIGGQEQQVARYNYAPGAGLHSNPQQYVTITINYLSINVWRPTRQVTVSETYDGYWHYFDWSVTGQVTPWSSIFDPSSPFAQFAMTIIVPQGAEVYAYGYGWINWFLYGGGGMWINYDTNSAYWAYVNNL